jgi:AraC-like DNA-binding protein
LNEIYYWHFHPEIELVYVEAGKGIRHIGDHICTYEGSDLALIGSYIPHLNFDYGVKTTVETVVVQFRQNFYEDAFYKQPEMQAIYDLFERAKTGIAFYGETKKIAGELLKKLTGLSAFDQLLLLIQVFQQLATSKEYTSLNTRPIASHAVIKEQERMHQIYKFVEANFQKPIKIIEIARVVSLSEAAFCRYFKIKTGKTYTNFLHEIRIKHACKLLTESNLSTSQISNECGFVNFANFFRYFKQLTGKTPAEFKKINAESLITDK